ERSRRNLAPKALRLPSRAEAARRKAVDARLTTCRIPEARGTGRAFPGRDRTVVPRLSFERAARTPRNSQTRRKCNRSIGRSLLAAIPTPSPPGGGRGMSLGTARHLGHGR